MTRPSRAPRPSFVAHIQRSAVDRSYVVVVVLWSVLLLVGLVAFFLLLTGLNTGAAAFGPLLFALICVPNLVIYVWIWRATRGILEPMVLTADGVRFVTPRGQVGLPWAGVRAVTVTKVFGRPQLNVLLDPQLRPADPGVSSELSRGAWRTVHRSGLRLSLRIIAESPQSVLAAVASLSEGRFRPELPR